VIHLEPHPHGVVLSVRAQPGARDSRVRGEQDGALKVAVTQVAEKGKANQAIVALLAKSLGLAKSRIELISGATSRDKRFLIHDGNAAELAARLQERLVP